MINSSLTSNTSEKFGPSSPFIMFQPFNVVSFISVFSPVILITLILSYSLFFQNFKGFVYLGFLMAATILRSVFLQATGSEKNKESCVIVRYADYGNPTFTTFVFGFTMVYLLLPMFQVGAVNLYLLVFLIFYLIFDLMIRTMQGCINLSKQLSSVIADFSSGAILSGLIIAAMYAGGSNKYLFFADSTSNGNICSMPKKQTFKCQVYKNGELVSG